MYSTLLTELKNNLLTVTINRPEKLNALNKTVITELAALLNDVYDNNAIHGVIITGVGEKAFVAGADIGEFESLDSSAGADLARFGQQEVFDRIEHSPKPIVAAVNGFALGGGCELALACHFIYASDRARFGQPEVNLGLIPGYGGTQRLTQLVGKNMAMELILSGKMLTAQEAHEAGIVNHVCAPDELLQKTSETLSLICSKAPGAVARAIACINRFDHNEQGYHFEIEQFGACFGTPEMQEGTSAFLQKRKPVFR